MTADELFSLFASRARAHPDREFVRTMDGEVTYGEAADTVDTYACRFADAGLDVGDTVVVLLDNSPAFLYAVLAAARCGVVAACVNTDMRGRGLVHLLEQAGASTVVSTAERFDDIAAELDRVSLERRMRVADMPDPEEATDSGASGETSDPAAIRSTDLAVLLHTSGTTGLPKWCELSHEYLLRLGAYVADRFEIAPSDVVFDPLPLFHVNPLGYYFLGGLTAGATLGLVREFSVSDFWTQVKTLSATVVVLHMAPKDMLLDRTTAEDAAGHDVRVLFPADVEFMCRFDIPKTVTGYGSTEAGGLTHTNKFTHVPETLPDEEDLSQFAGEPRSDVRVRVVDDYGRPVDGTERGEILVRPEAPGVIFDGYHDEPERTAAAFEGLWYNTGDLGYRDEDGLLHFVGRIENAISYKGQFVNVDLVESVLESHPAVDRAVVVGVSDDVVGQRVFASVVRSDEIAPGELLDAVRPDLPRFMLPEYVEFVDGFPRVEGTEKIDRNALVERGVADAWHWAE